MPDLELDILIDASPETIFQLLTVADKHVEWEGTDVELDPSPGGVYRVLVAGEYQAVGEFVEVVPNERIVHTFGWDMEGNPITPGSTTVTYTLEREGDKTRLRLVHSGLPDEDAVEQHSHGWSHYMGRLAQRAGGDDPGPDTGPN